MRAKEGTLDERLPSLVNLDRSELPLVFTLKAQSKLDGRIHRGVSEGKVRTVWVQRPSKATSKLLEQPGSQSVITKPAGVQLSQQWITP